MSITCSSDFGVSAISWLLDGQVVSTVIEGELSISKVNESHHDRIYTCRATAPFGVQEHTITLQVEGMHPLIVQTEWSQKPHYYNYPICMHKG